MVFASPLITPARLLDNLDNPDWIIFDCRHELANPGYGEMVYGEGHLPGARFAHLDRNLSSPPSPEHGRHPLPDEATFTGWLGSQGVTPDKTVVAYDNQGMFSARLWWLMIALGHKKVHVLDGGYRAWQKDSAPTTTELPAIHPARYVGNFNRSMIVELDEMEKIFQSRDVLLVDARGKDRYLGKSEPLDKAAGHIPGARNIPFPGNVDEEGQFRDANFLKERFGIAKEVEHPDNIIHYCGSGVSACHNILAMAIAGLQPGRLYAGSWSQWCANPQRPVETEPNL